MDSVIEVKECFERYRNEKGFTKIVYRDKAGHVFQRLESGTLISVFHQNTAAKLVKQFSERSK